MLVLLIVLPILASCYVPLKENSKVIEGEQFLEVDEGKSRGSIVDVDGSGDGDDLLISSTTASTITTPSSATFITTTSSSLTCYDLSPKCQNIKHLCTAKIYRFIMVKNCAKTCDACDQFVRLPRPTRCRDAFKSCSSWSKNGFCHRTYYTLDERKNLCRKSCKTC